MWQISLPTLLTKYMSAVDVTQVVKKRSYIIDEPIAPSLASPRSPGGSLRCVRAKSFPVPQYMHSQQMLELPTAEKEAQTAAAVEPKKVCVCATNHALAMFI